MGFIPALLRGVFTVLAFSLKGPTLILIKLWPIIIAVVSLAVAFWPYLRSAYEVVTANASAVWVALTDAHDTASAFMAAGWPVWLANGFGHVNQYWPVVEQAVMLATLITAWILCGLVRIVKSVIPAVAT